MTNSPMLKAAGNSELLTFTDSDFASCKERRKSRSGAYIFFRNSLIYWKSGKQNQVSRNTTETEFYALLDGITEVEFLQDVIHFAYKVDKRTFNCKNTPISCDNSSAGKIASSIESIARTKHIEVAHLWIQQELRREPKFLTVSVSTSMKTSAKGRPKIPAGADWCNANPAFLRGSMQIALFKR
jgi:hypothetical protein